MVPSGSLLAEPFSVTTSPELTACAGPALAVGDKLVLPPLLLLPEPPPPPPQPQSSSAATPANAKPSLKWRMVSYTCPG